MTTRASAKSKNKKTLETTLGKAPLYTTDDPIDLSHLRKPIDTSIFGLRQVLTLFETATDEVRRYVAYECDVMYECRICRTIFRSLANFILHKRNYCRESYNQNDHTNCRNNCQENEFYVAEEEPDLVTVKNASEQSSGTTSPIPPKCDSKLPETVSTNSQPELKEAKKNINYVLRRLQGRQESNVIAEQCLTEDISNESKNSEEEGSKNNVSLERITPSATGVFQTMFRSMIDEYKGDLMKTEVMEIHNILENNEAILGSDGKIVPSDIDKSAIFMCTVCNHKFSTKKTLTYHIKYKHNNTRLVYQCPECNDTFANAWSVFRHLYKIHRKTTAQVKRLRNQVHANIIRRDEKPEQKNTISTRSSSEPTSASQYRVDLENQQWMDDLEGDNDLQRCGGCGRKFERKAALHSHSQFCSKRIAVCNTIKENSAKRTHTEEKQSDKVTKNSKTSANHNIENVIKGAKRRKPLISHRMCRIDYIKENEKTEDSKSEQETKEEEEAEVINDTEISNCNKEEVVSKEEVITDTQISNCNNDKVVIENLVSVIDLHENDESLNKEILVIQKLDNDDVDNNKIENDVEEKKCSSRNSKRSTSRSSDDVIYVDTITLSPNDVEIMDTGELIPNVDKNEDLIMPNNIVTRSRSRLDSDNKKSLEETEVVLLEVQKLDVENNEKIVEKSDTLMPAVSVEKVVETKNTSNDVKQNSAIASQNDLIESVTKDSTDECKRKYNRSYLINSKRRKIDHPKIKNLHKSAKVTLETKSSKYIDEQKNTCVPCKKKFKCPKSLMKHMSVHFNWYRYQCRSCLFMAYSRSKCDRHAKMKHDVHDEAILKNTILHIPSWKTINLSTNFVECTKKQKVEKSEVIVNKVENDEEKEERTQKVAVEKEVQISASTKPTENIVSQKPDVQDASIRKMIMEVIFGSGDTETSEQSQEQDASNVQPKNEVDVVDGFRGFQNPEEVFECSKIETSLASSILRDTARPVRNRVTTVQKDFLYDLTQILKPKITKDKEVGAAGQNRDIEIVKKQKSLKVYTKDTKAKTKKPLPVPIMNGKKSNVSKKVPHDLESQVQLVQDINMNSRDLKKHVTGDCE